MYNRFFTLTEIKSPFKDVTPMFSDIELNGLFIDMNDNLCQKVTNNSYHTITDKDGILMVTSYTNLLPTHLIKTILHMSI